MVKVISWNVNGIRAVTKKGLVPWLASTQPDIFCMQETRATLEQVPKEVLEMPGYDYYFVSGEKGGYSGVGILTKIKPRQVITGLDIPAFDREGRVIILDFGDWQLLNSYFPNGSGSPERLDYKLAFYDEIAAYAKNHKNVVICGDLNTAHTEIDLAHPKAHEKHSGFLPEERQWITDLLQQGYVDSFRQFHQEGGQYSWWDMKTRARTRNVGWRLDYVFVPCSMAGGLQDGYILADVYGSDHCPVGIDIKIFLTRLEKYNGKRNKK